MRIFAAINIRTGPDGNGNYAIQPVPILYGDPDALVAQIIKGASTNTLLPMPMFSVWIEDIKPAPKRRQATQYVGKVTTEERHFDVASQTYGSGPGVRQDIERYMPSPYDFKFRLDFWSTNTTTKLQVLEQIQMIFNPSLQLQQNSNILDWTSIFECFLEDITWTQRTTPMGLSITQDVMSLRFTIPGWINPPAKLKRSGYITEIITRVFEDIDVATLESEIEGIYDPLTYLGSANPIQIVTTLGNYKISVAAGTGSDIITLLNDQGEADPTLNWNQLIQLYGQITPGITNIQLNLTTDIENTTDYVLGSIVQDPVHQNILLFTPDTDTLPGTSLLPIADIIDPTEVYPGHGLPIAAAGQRYLLTSNDSVGEEPAIPPYVTNSPWGPNIIAYPNDIIEYNGISWVVIFSSRSATGKNYVINSSNSSQYTFENGIWTYTYYGIYSPGYWRINNIIKAPNGTTISAYE